MRHDSLGYLLWREWASSKVDPREAALFDQLHAVALPGELLDRRDLADLLQPWMAAVLGHHGRPPEERLHGLPSEVFRLGAGESIARSRLDAAGFVDALKSLLAPPPLTIVEAGYEAQLARMRRSSWWLAGFVIVCDWLGSNSEYFAHEPRAMPLEQYWARARAAAVNAVAESGLGRSMPRRFEGIAALFKGRLARPTPLQQAAAEVAVPAEPQLFFLEDLTGAGKTEAALILAQRLMSEGLADGLFFALPTMATANAMAPRVEPLVPRLFAGTASFLLSHSGPRLTETDRLALCGERGGDSAREIDTPSATVAATAWLSDSRKKALLAEAGVGTIDQALLAVLQSRHAALRLFGLHRRVLVVDEVHACDAYMLGVLAELLRAHAAMGGSAILISATLPTEQRRELARAFAEGRGGSAQPLPGSCEYPLLTQVVGGALVERPVAPRQGSPRTLPVSWLHSQTAVLDRIVAAARAGQCVCWIRNSVKDALEAYQALAALLPPDALTLFHARFALGDRLRIEQDVVARFGEGNEAARSGRVVVATQVVEQSLDVDFDVMVTDLCPIDLVVQRAGRLQRHPARHPGRAPPVLEVFAPEWSEDPAAGWLGGPFRRTAMVYDNPGVLWRSMGVLRAAGRLDLPRDARNLVESVYGSDVAAVPAGLEARSNAAEGEDMAHASVAKGAVIKLDLGYLREGADWSSEARTPTRLGEPTITVRLAKLDGDGRPEPWEGHTQTHRWALSQVSVARRLVAKPAPEEDPLRLEAEETQPFVGDDVVTVVLRPAGDGAWEGRAIAERKVRGALRDVSVRVLYSPVYGLSVVDREE